MNISAGIQLKKFWVGLSQEVYLQYLLWQARPALIKGHLDRKQFSGPPADSHPGESREKVRVAAIQSRLFLVENIPEYVDELYRHTAEAVAQGADLVVFPEDNGAHLLGLLPGIRNLSRETGLKEALASLGDAELTAGDIFSYLTPVTRQVYFTTFRELSRRFGIYIMGGSIITRQEGSADNHQGNAQQGVFNSAYLFDPSGELAGRQVKAHLLPLEAEWGISCGSDLQVFATPMGNLAFPICMDATYFETFRILADRGAEIIMVPTANPDSYNFWKALRGTWPRVQETPVYGVTSALVGSVLGLELTGRAGIFAPLELTPNGDGVLAQAPDPHREAVVVADLDLDSLHQYKAESRIWAGLNRKLVAKYLPGLY